MTGLDVPSVVTDWLSRKVIGWAAKPTFHRELVLDDVLQVARRRRPCDTVIDSDQETQYGRKVWWRICRTNRLKSSMSRKGNCWENAVAESFFSSLKKERVKKHIHKARELALKDVSEYIESFYSLVRRHSHSGGIIPDQFEAAHIPKRRGVH